jgi:hypothetical protein
MAKKVTLEKKGHPPLEIPLDDMERILLNGAYGSYSLTLVFKGGLPHVNLQLNEGSYVKLVRTVTAVRTLVKNPHVKENAT